MIHDKSMAFLIGSLIFLAIVCVAYLSTFLSRNTENLRKRELVADLDATTSPPTETTGTSSLSFPTAHTPVTPKIRDDDKVANQHPSPKDDQSSNPFTADEIWTLIEDMETQRDELQKKMDEKKKLYDMSVVQMEELDVLFQAMVDGNLNDRQELTRVFEDNVLDGASIYETTRNATAEELEELRSKPGAKSLLDLILKGKEDYKQWASQSKALVDRTNALAHEYGSIYEEILAIDNSITELKAMLR